MIEGVSELRKEILRSIPQVVDEAYQRVFPTPSHAVQPEKKDVIE